MSTKTIIHCRYCAGPREATEFSCTGCGAPIANARTKPPAKRKKPSAACPRCNSTRNQQIEPGRYLCHGCRGVFELDDFGFLDTRAEQNYEKKHERRKR